MTLDAKMSTLFEKAPKIALYQDRNKPVCIHFFQISLRRLVYNICFIQTGSLLPVNFINIAVKTMKQEYAKDHLANGVRVITAPMPSTRSITVMVMVSAGSRYESRNINGLSHFMEHMFFKGAKRYPDAMAVASAIDSVGGVFNAFTSEEKVAYFVKLSSGKKEIAYDLLSDMLLNSKFDKDEIDRERGVIIEEIRMYNDDPMSRVQIDFKERFYGDCPLGWDVAGPEENITTVTRDDFINFRDRHYQTDSCVISVAGDITHEENMAICERFFTFEGGGDPAPKAAPYTPSSGSRSYLSPKETEQAHFVLGFPIPGDEHEDQPTLKTMNNILGGTMSSRLFHQVRERRGLAYYIRSSRCAFTDTGALKISAGVNVNKLGDAIKCVMDEARKAVESGFTEEELIRGQENIKGRTDLSLEDSMSVAGLYASQETLHSKIKTAEELSDEISAVTLDDLQRVASKYINPDNVKLTVLGPYKEITPFDEALN